MASEAIETGSRSLRVSVRRLLGLHEHAYGAWQSQSAVPVGAARMFVQSTRNCQHCQRWDFKAETVDIPASGFPYELHLKLSARRGD